VTGAIAASLLYLLFWPVEARVEAWDAPPAPVLAGPYQRNERLAQMERIDLGGATGPEDVAVDRRGRLYTGTEDGRILRLDPERIDGGPTTFARTGGRPMGLAFTPGGELVVADLRRGLLAVTPGGGVRTLVRAVGGRPLGRTNGVALGPDGSVYFTDASWAHPEGPATRALLEHRPTGRLLRYDPEAERAEVLLDSLYFANGVAVSHDGSFLLVAETGAYRVRRVELEGKARGRSRVVRDNLPGFPDGVTAGDGERFWLTLASPRSRVLDALLPHPFLRTALLRIPEAMRPGPRRYGFVLTLDGEGRILETFQDPGGRYAPITSAVPVGEALYLGSDREDGLGRIPRPLFGDPDGGGRKGSTGAVRLVARREAPSPSRLQELPFDTLALARGPFAAMGTRVEKTIFGVDVLSLHLRVDEATARRLARSAELGGDRGEVEDSLAAAVREAREVWAVVHFHRSFGRDQMIEGTLRNISGAVDAGWIDPDTFTALEDSLPRWLHFLQGRGVVEDDTLHFRIRSDTVYVLHRTEDGRTVGRERQVSPVRRGAVLARYLAPGSDFREGLARSLLER